MNPTPMPSGWLRLLALLAVAAAGAPGSLGAQETESPMSPAGRLRVDFSPSLMLWDSRFGLREGFDGSEPLGFDLVDPEGYGIFPGVATLRSGLRDLLDDPGLELPLGASRAEVSAERIRLPFRLGVGVFEWLTVGVTVPLEKNRTEVTHLLSADSSELGITPSIQNPAEVGAFLDDVDRALADLRSVGNAPELEQDLASFLESLTGLYETAALFPAAGTVAGAALGDRLATLNTMLTDAGVTAVQPGLPLASAPLTGPAGVTNLLLGPGFGYGTGLDNLEGVWALGDVEVHAAVRFLRGAVRDSAGAPARLSWEMGVGGLIRLPTGTTDDPDLLFDLGSGDGQTDLEGRIFANFQVGRFGLWADGRYGQQGSTTLVRRVAPPDQVLVPLSARRTVEWTPGDYLRLEVAPRVHLTPELALMAGYRYVSKSQDEYAEVDGAPIHDPATFQGYLGPVWDAEVLSAETEWVAHELGGGLIFSTVEAWREGRTELPFEVVFSVRTAVAGSGGATPEALTAQFGLRVYRRIWGG